MKTFRKILSLVLTTATIALTMVLPVSAGGTYEPTSNYVRAGGRFSAGGSVYFANTSTVTSNDGKYDVYLESYIYDGLTTNARPYNTYTYIRAYTDDTHEQAGKLATFTAAGYGYSYYYEDGYGGSGHTYCLKSNSSNNSLGANVTTRWHA